MIGTFSYYNKNFYDRSYSLDDTHVCVMAMCSNWGDHCGMVARACKEDGKSVVTHRTPAGLREADWRKGLELYRNAQK
jgi:hypothetical protein